ncbi:type II secretion system F family protein [Endozoicomonadaceae bacterium StTr2]
MSGMDAFIIPLLISLTVATVFVFRLNRYFISQFNRGWLGLPHTITSWKRFFGLFEYKINYRRKDIDQSLIQAGIYNSRLALWYLPAKLLFTSLLAVAVLISETHLGIETREIQIATVLAGVVVIIILPDIVLQLMARRRTRRISRQLPYLLDLMATCVQTGMTIESSVAYLGKELETFDKDLAFIVTQLDTRARVIGMNNALDELQQQIPSNAMRSFVYTLSQSLQYGSSIFDVLIRLSGNLRDIDMLELEEKAGKLSARMSVPLALFIMFPIVILIIAPSIMRVLSDG